MVWLRNLGVGDFGRWLEVLLRMFYLSTWPEGDVCFFFFVFDEWVLLRARRVGRLGFAGRGGG